MRTVVTISLLSYRFNDRMSREIGLLKFMI